MKKKSAAALLLATQLLACADVADLVPPTVDEDPGLPSLELNGTKVHLETFGDPRDPVVIFLHGGPGGGDYRAWLRHTALAEDGYYLVMWDQRGAGLSRRHPAESYTLDLYVEDLDALIGIVTAESVVKEVTLVGHSWGGQYATLYTTRHPERVRRLVLSEPGPFTGAIFAEIAPAVMGVDPTTAFANELVWSELFLTADDHARADLRHALIALNGVANGYHFSETDPFPFWRMGAAASQGVLAQAVDENGDYAFDFTQGLERFTPEVLFIRGSLNEIHDLGYHQREMALYPNPTLVTLDGHGHDFIWTAAEAHLSAIRAYLAR